MRPATPPSPQVTAVRFTPASAGDARQGLLGFLRVEFEPGLQIDGATLRRTLGGQLAVTWPRRRDGHGRAHRIVHLTSGAARRSVEAQVLDSLRGQGVLP